MQWLVKRWEIRVNQGNSGTIFLKEVKRMYFVNIKSLTLYTMICVCMLRQQTILVKERSRWNFYDKWRDRIFLCWCISISLLNITHYTFLETKTFCKEQANRSISFSTFWCCFYSSSFRYPPGKNVPLEQTFFFFFFHEVDNNNNDSYIWANLFQPYRCGTFGS